MAEKKVLQADLRKAIEALRTMREDLRGFDSSLALERKRMLDESITNLEKHL